MNKTSNNEMLKSIEMLVEKIISISDSMIKKANYDKTFESTIVKKKKKKDGIYIYTIKYNNADYEVKSSIGEIKSKNVWVKIPCNNLNKMHICGIR